MGDFFVLYHVVSIFLGVFSVINHEFLGNKR